MLTLHSSNGGRFCDGLVRRDFLKIGGLAMGGLSLPELLRAEDSQGTRSNHKAVIMVFLPGGPSHQDMVDLKMDAPSEIRGEFKPINTNVDGLQICEHLPKLAKMMDKFTVIRSMADCEPSHDAFQCLTGRSSKGQPPGGWPSLVRSSRSSRDRRIAQCQPLLACPPRWATCSGHARASLDFSEWRMVHSSPIGVGELMTCRSMVSAWNDCMTALLC